MGKSDILASKHYGKYAIVKNNIIKSINDKRKYKYITMENKLSVLLISDKETKISAASMTVNTGSYDNPKDCEGLAHFLEHMLFMGTKKYPDENKFMSYLNQYGGTTNAFTDNEITTYYFSIHNNNFIDALDIFAQFFIDPLFLEDTVEREIEAVNAEHTKNLNSDGWIINQLFTLLIDGDHEHKKYGCGTSQTLKKSNIRNRLIEFYNNHYSANIMKLVVLDSNDITKMEDYVRNIFILIKNKNIMINKYDSPFFNIRNTKLPFYKLMKTVPINDGSVIKLFWQISNITQPDGKAMNYISGLIGHESEGSILYTLKKYGLATNLECSLYEHNRYYGIFYVSINLTNKGEAHIVTIIKIVHYYIDLIKKNLNREYYDESKNVSELIFKYIEKNDPMEFVKVMSTSLCYIHNPKYVLIDNYYYKGFKYALKYITKILDELDEHKCLIIATSKKYKNEAIHEEYFFKAKYIIYKDNVNYDMLSRKTNDTNDNVNNDIFKELHIIKKNNYIPSNISFLTSSEKTQRVPIKIDKNGPIEIWYMNDGKFKVPYVIMSVIINIPTLLNTPKIFTCFDIFVKLLSYYMMSEKYYMGSANSSLNIKNKYDVIEINIVSYPSIIFNIVKYVINNFFNMEIEKEVFDTTIAEYKKSIKNVNNAPPNFLCKKYFVEKNCHNICSDKDILDVIDKITISDVNNIKNMFINKHIVKAYVHGNINIEKTLKICSMFNIFSKKNIENIVPITETPVTYIKELKHSEEYTFIKLLTNKSEKNNCIFIYYEIGNIKKNVTNGWLYKLLFLYITYNFLSEKFFNQLRTIEQLGYLVSCNVNINGSTENNSYFLNFMVQSPYKCPDEIQVRIKKFIYDNYQYISNPNNFNEGNYDELVKTTIQNLTSPHNNIFEKYSKFKSEILNGDYMFNINKVLKKSKNVISLKRFKEMYYDYLINRNTRKIRMIKIYSQKFLFKQQN